MERLRLTELLPHKFEEVMLQRIARTDVNKHSEVLVTLLEVYVDNFIAMSNDIRHSHLKKLSQVMLNGIHAIFPHPKSRDIMGLTRPQRKKG